MPHLQFDINKKLTSEQRIKFINLVEKKFSEVMKTGSAHIAISIREFPKNALSLGRAQRGSYVCFMNLDIRDGRSTDKKKQLVKSYMNAVENIIGIKQENQYLTYTSHKGGDFNLYEKSLDDWIENDVPIVNKKQKKK